MFDQLRDVSRMRRKGSPPALADAQKKSIQATNFSAIKPARFVWRLKQIRSVITALLLCACMLPGCLPAPQAIDNSQNINAGVNIVPEAVLASQKIRPSTAPTSDEVPDLIDVISTADQKHYTIVELLRSSGLIPLLQKQGPYTVLAPTDEAFDKLPPGAIARLLLPAHHAQLVAFVKYHVLDGRIGSTDLLQTNGLVPTLAGNKVIIRGIGDKVMINDANVLRTDTGASNGTVHWLDSVLLPEG